MGASASVVKVPPATCAAVPIHSHLFSIRLMSDHPYPNAQENVHPDVTKFPKSLVLRLDKECLTLLSDLGGMSNGSNGGKMLCQWNYVDIMCWGHSSTTFQFRVFDPQGSTQRKKAVYAFATREGAVIQASLLATVLSLMERTKREALNDSEMNELVQTIAEDESYDSLRQLATHRSLTAQQALRLIRRFGHDEFDKVECCVICYTQLLNKSSLQLLLGEFADAAARENVLVRLGIEHDGCVVSTSASVPTPQER